MIDLTPLEVRKKKGDFKRVMRGYEPALVDDFIELVADRLEDLVRTNLAHTDRLRQLEQQVRDYQERERALTEALVSAQELREEMREQALREADLSRRTAEQDAERIRTDAQRALEQEAENLRRLRARQAQFIQTYRTMLERELDELAVAAEGIAYRRSAEGEAGTEADVEVEPARRAGRPRETDRQLQPEATHAAAPEPDPAPEPEPERAPEPPPQPEPAREPERAVAREPEAPRASEPVPEPEAPHESVQAATEGQVDDDELERSLEALQVVFARDQDVQEASLDWPEPELPSDPVGFYEPASLQQPAVPEPEPAPRAPEAVIADDAASTAFAQESDYELLLEDAIEEGNAATVEHAPATWLPKLIEDEP